jgi:hypothetical protein
MFYLAWSRLFSSACFNASVAIVVNRIMLNTIAAIPILKVRFICGEESAKISTSIKTNTKISWTPFNPSLKLMIVPNCLTACSAAPLINFLYFLLLSSQGRSSNGKRAPYRYLYCEQHFVELFSLVVLQHWRTWQFVLRAFSHF